MDANETCRRTDQTQVFPLLMDNLYSPNGDIVASSAAQLEIMFNRDEIPDSPDTILRVYAAIKHRWGDPIDHTAMEALLEDVNNRSRKHGGTALFEEPLNWLTCLMITTNPDEECSCLTSLQQSIRNYRDTGKILSRADQDAIRNYLSNIPPSEPVNVHDAARRVLAGLTFCFGAVPSLTSRGKSA